MNKIRLFAVCAAIAVSTGLGFKSQACTRVIYHGNDNLIIIGRSLDWKTPIPTNVYAYPRGMQKQGSDQSGAVTWTSKYGAVYAVGYDGGVTEGMNEKGLSVNGLFCKGTIYNNPSNNDRRPISLAMFPAWILDTCANVEEAVALLEKQDFTLGGATFDGGTVSALHWGITDAEGHTAIVEFQDGELHIYNADQDNVLTNDPTWPQMKAIIAYWEKIGGANSMPGSVSSPDRAVRANYFSKNVQKTSDPDLGANICRTILSVSCVPFGYITSADGEPNVSMTQWCSFSNLRDRRYYFNMATGNGFYYVDLNKLNLKEGAPVLKIETKDHLNSVGDISSKMKKSAPFTPMH